MAHARARRLNAPRSTSGRDAFAAAIDALPSRRREAFLLRMFDDLSCDEIAAVMGTTRQTVANQLTRALATLRASLAHVLD